MTEKQVVMKYLDFCRMGRIPRVLYKVNTGDFLVYSVADPRMSMNEEPIKKGYADISTYVWAYAQFGDILTAIRAAVLLYETDSGTGRTVNTKAVTAKLRETVKYNPMLTSYDSGAVLVNSRYDKGTAEEEYEELEGKFLKDPLYTSRYWTTKGVPDARRMMSKVRQER